MPTIYVILNKSSTLGTGIIPHEAAWRRLQIYLFFLNLLMGGSLWMELALDTSTLGNLENLRSF